MKRILKHFRYGEKGFTLIELLVVIGMLGVLAAVAVPNVSRFIGRGTTESALTELQNVQTAVTAMMADQTPPITAVTAVLPANSTNAMAAFPASNPLFGGAVNYMQKTGTKYYYSVAADGTVSGWYDTPGVTPIQ